jgi:hypothetical protein
VGIVHVDEPQLRATPIGAGRQFEKPQGPVAAAVLYDENFHGPI